MRLSPAFKPSVRPDSPHWTLQLIPGATPAAVDQASNEPYLDKDALRQEASECVAVAGGAARQADVELR